MRVNAQGFIRNEIGRLRRLPEIKSSQFFLRAAAERQAVNFPIQSLQADIIKIAMINIFKEIKANDNEVRMLLQVHDELVFEIKENKVSFWAEKIRTLMEDAYNLSVPVIAEAKVGDNWGEMQKLEL